MNLTDNLPSAHNSNQDFIRKAVSIVSDYTPGGALLPAQQKTFVDIQIERSPLLQRCRTEIIPTPTYEIDKWGFTEQVLHSDEEGVANASNAIASPAMSKVTHVTKRYRAETAMTYDLVKRTIANGTLMNALVKGLGGASVRDLTKVALRGDTSLAATSPLNKLLRTQDGFLKQITTNTVDALGARVNLDLLDQMRIQMPDEYYDQDGLEYLTTKNGLIHFEQAVSARATELGDQAFRSANESSFHKIPVKSDMLMPRDLTYNSAPNYSSIVLGNVSEQFMVGYLEEMTVRMVEDPRAGVFYGIIRYDVSFKVLHEAALVKGTNVKNT